MSGQSKIVPRPAGMLSPGKEARLQQLIGDADTAQPLSAEPQSGAEVAPAPTETPQAEDKLPRNVRKRKEAISLTINPGLLLRLDKAAERSGISRAAAIGIAASHWVEEEERKAEGR